MSNYTYKTETPKDITTTILTIANQLSEKPSEMFVTALKEIESVLGITDCILEFAHEHPDVFNAKYRNWITHGLSYTPLRKAKNIYDVTVNNYTFNWESDYESSVNDYIDRIVKCATDLMVLGDNITCLDLRVREVNKLEQRLIDYCEKENTSVTKEDIIQALSNIILGDKDDDNTKNSNRICYEYYACVSDDKFDDKATLIYSFYYLLNYFDNLDNGIENKNKDLEAFRRAYSIIDSSANKEDVISVKQTILNRLTLIETESTKEDIAYIKSLIEKNM